MDSNAARKISADSTERLWFVARGNVLKGPFSTSQLQEKVRKHELNYFDFCWRQGFSEWRPMGSSEDFNRRNTLKRIPQYPQVEVPASSTGGIYLVDTSPPEEEVLPGKTFLRGLPSRKRPVPSNAKIPAPLPDQEKPLKKFELSFARHKRFSISIYEWGLAAIFAVTLAYFAADHAMNEVSHAVTRQLATINAGTFQFRGETSTWAVTPKTWEPVYSAPSFDQMTPLPSNLHLGLAAPLSLPVILEGQIPAVAKGGLLQLGGYDLNMTIAESYWNSSQQGLDPIYIRPLQVKGFLNLKKQNEVWVPQLGEPFLPQTAQ